MKTTQKQFELFKTWCRYYIEKFQLNNWQIDFYLTDIEGVQAQVFRDYLACTARVNFNATITKSPDETWEQLIKDTAKHEMIHVKLGNLAQLAASRFVTPDELEKAEEELTVKLCNIIK